jgi:DNA ligase D-like protein (predicted ligase)
VHTEDHPLEYATFEGSIPKGEYGGGKVIVWDSGTYETEKFRDNPPDGPAKGGEVIVMLHGSRVSGRYALIQTDGKNWLAHRMKEQPTSTPADVAPMLASHGSVDKLKAGQWAFEGKWDGYRLLVDADHGALTLRSRSGRDVTADFPQLDSLAADLADHHVLLDGEIVALDDSGVPSFGAMQNRGAGANLEFWAFDVLSLDGRSLLRAKYSDRRKVLEVLADGGGLIVPDQLPGDGPEALEYAQKHRWEGVVAKKRDSTYQPGRRSASWIKDKLWLTQEVIIGGWRAGEGGRTSGIGALLVGVPEDDGLHFAGRVGTGFTDKDLACTPSNHRSPQSFPARTQKASRSSSRRWWGRCAIANGPPTAGCVNRVGAGCVRTNHLLRLSGSRRVHRREHRPFHRERTLVEHRAGHDGVDGVGPQRLHQRITHADAPLHCRISFGALAPCDGQHVGIRV